MNSDAIDLSPQSLGRVQDAMDWGFVDVVEGSRPAKDVVISMGSSRSKAMVVVRSNNCVPIHVILSLSYRTLSTIQKFMILL